MPIMSCINIMKTDQCAKNFVPTNLDAIASIFFTNNIFIHADSYNYQYFCLRKSIPIL
jgi:hypothetical protein